MATLTFTYDTGVVAVADIVTAICGNYGYQATIPDPQNPGQTIANPETQAAFAKRMVKNFIADNYKAYDINNKRNAIVGATVTLV